MAKKFKKNFIFGTATSSYQIEGAAAEDGKSPSIWDVFCKTPGKVYGGHNGDIACDHYHRYKEDIKLMSDIGINAYRFSISWPRIFPERGTYNPKGMEFYKKLLGELCEKGIMPVATLYHWDMPIWVYERGGWLKRDSVKWFEEYAVRVFEELNTYVKLWITHNEPYCQPIHGYAEGIHAPGHKDMREALIAAHHILLSHGAAVETFRKYDFKNSEIGITLNLTPAYPASDSKEDVEAAYRSDGMSNRWFLDPIFQSSYPEDMKKVFSKFVGKFDFICDGDLEKISIKNDFLGVNYYTSALIKFSRDSKFGFENARSNFEKTTMGWNIWPEPLYNLIKRLKQEYTEIPIYIMENGAAFDDVLSSGKMVHDVKRIDYIKRHLMEIAKLNEQGADIRGYFIWSLMDNFEWQHGYSKRFGIVYVDYETQERILKDSALWYKEFIKKRVIK